MAQDHRDRRAFVGVNIYGVVVGRIGLLFFAMCLVKGPSHAGAQDVTTEANWDVEVRAGLLTSAGRLADASLQPLPGSTAFGAVGGPNLLTRAVSSWFFGDGTALFNQVAALHGISTRIVPLDQALLKGITRRRGGPTLGVAAARWMTSRLAFELQADYSPSAVVMDGPVLAATEASSTSFTQAWSDFLQSGVAADGVFSDVLVTADTERGGGHEVLVIGGLKAVVHAKRRSRVYVAGGIGTFHAWGRAPSVTIAGSYDFAGAATTSTGIVRLPFAERDRVTIRTDGHTRRGVVGTIRGGFEYYVHSRRGVRVDIALLLRPANVSTLLDASPAVAVLDPEGAVSGVTNPTIQFSNRPLSAVRSSLSGPAVQNVVTFKGEGLEVQPKVSVGYFFRF